MTKPTLAVVAWETVNGPTFSVVDLLHCVTIIPEVGQQQTLVVEAIQKYFRLGERATVHCMLSHNSYVPLHNHAG